MRRRIDIAGCKFGKFTAISFYEKRRTEAYWLCRCDCGSERVVASGKLRRGLSTSCGCNQGIPKSRHGLTKTVEYHIWQGIKQRCYDLGAESYQYYGGRGIKLCERWQVFKYFLDDMGSRPSPSHSIGRIDNDQDYRPDNCRWETPSEQARNTRRTHFVEVGGLKMPLADASEKFGIPYDTLKRRSRAGDKGDRLFRPVPTTRPWNKGSRADHR